MDEAISICLVSPTPIFVGASGAMYKFSDLTARYSGDDDWCFDKTTYTKSLYTYSEVCRIHL